MRFDQKDFSDKTQYPSNETIQFKCLHKLVKSQPGTRKVTHFAELAECDTSTILKAFKKKLKPKQPILSKEISKTIATKKKSVKVLVQLCPEYESWPEETLKEILNIK